jgi:uncharacterized protein (UPF0335 family)
VASVNLFQGLTPEEKKVYKEQLKHSPLIEKVREIIRDEIRRIETPSKDVYKDAAWAYRQADENGERRAFLKILTILDQKEK